MDAEQNKIMDAELQTIAQRNRQQCELRYWLTKNKGSIFSAEVAKGKDYVVVVQHPPKKLHLFGNKEAMLEFLADKPLFAYSYRRSNEMILMY
jgi:hypothetical protein